MRCRPVPFALVLLVAGCNGDYDRRLPNGYKLDRTNAYTIAIFAPPGVTNATHATAGVAVAAKIDAIAIVGDFVMGHVTPSPQSELARYQRPGFFILDTTSGRVLPGLSKSAYVSQVKAHGFPLPQLMAPSSLPGRSKAGSITDGEGYSAMGGATEEIMLRVMADKSVPMKQVFEQLVRERGKSLFMVKDVSPIQLDANREAWRPNGPGDPVMAFVVINGDEVISYKRHKGYEYYRRSRHGIPKGEFWNVGMMTETNRSSAGRH